MYQVQEPQKTPPGNPAAQGPPGVVLSGTCDALKHEIHGLTSCPSAHWQIDLLASLALKRFQIGNGDGFHFNESPAIEGFDLKDFPFRDDFTGFFVGSAADSRGCTE